jgi:hypothetical protein
MKALAAMFVAGFAVEAAGYALGTAKRIYQTTTASGILGAMLVAPIAAVAGIFAARAVSRGGVSLKAGTVLVLGGLFLAVLGLHAPESKFVLWPYVDTCFAPGFDRARFAEVQPGMSTARVKAILGSPLHLRDTTWGYMLSGSPDLIWSYSGDHCGPWDHAWRSFEVGFRKGKVITVSSVWRFD